MMETPNDCKKTTKQIQCLTRWWFQTFWIFTPTWGNDPIGLFFEIGWNHQLVKICLKVCNRDMDSGLLSGHWSLWIGSSCIFFYQPARARRGVSNMQTMRLCAEFVLLMWWYETIEFQPLYECYKRLPSFLLDKHCLARFGMHGFPPYFLTCEQLKSLSTLNISSSIIHLFC